MRITLVAIVLIIAAMAYVRLTPIAEENTAPRPETKPPGDYPSMGGFYAVRPGEDLKALVFEIEASPRVKKLGEGIYLTRSLFWGFPDIHRVWEEDGNTHIFAHLIYGGSDLGANRRRILRWLEALR